MLEPRVPIPVEQLATVAARYEAAAGRAAAAALLASLAQLICSVKNRAQIEVLISWLYPSTCQDRVIDPVDNMSG